MRPRPLAFLTLLILVMVVGPISLKAQPPETPPSEAREAPETQERDRPAVGEQAPAFELEALYREEPVRLADVVEGGPAVLVVLRGWPGYQCPICERQVGELRGVSQTLAEEDATVLLVYPGPAAELREHAREFVKEDTLPDNFRFLLDPDYTFTNQYGLRWDEPRQTAYPATFIIDRAGTVRYANISEDYRTRPKAQEVVEAVQSLDE